MSEREEKRSSKMYTAPMRPPIRGCMSFLSSFVLGHNNSHVIGDRLAPMAGRSGML